MNILLSYKTLCLLYSGYQYYVSFVLIKRCYQNTKYVLSWTYYIVQTPLKLLQNNDNDEWVII